jgi:hypothetical protein
MRVLLQKFLVGLCFLIPFSLSAQDEVQEIFGQLPARHTYELDRLMTQLADQGPTAVHEIVQSLKPMGLGEDNKARLALSGLAKYLGKTQHTNKAIIEESLLEELEEANIDVQFFVIEQLQFFCSDQAISGLKKYVKPLCEPVVQTIGQIGTDQAFNALVEVYGEANGYCKDAIVNAMATFDADIAQTQLINVVNELGSKTPSIAISRLADWGYDGLPSMLEALDFDAGQEEKWILEWAEAAAKKNNARVVHDVLKNMLTYNELTHQGPIYKLLISTGGISERDLVKDFRDKDPATALSIAHVLSDTDMPLEDFFKTASRMSPEIKAALVSTAMQRNDVGSLEYIKEYAKEGDQELRVLTLKAQAQLQGKSSILPLGEAIGDDQLRVVAGELLLHQIDSTNISTLIGLLDRHTGAAKAHVIRLLAKRKVVDSWPRISPLLESADTEIRAAAFEALPMLSGDANINELVAITPLVETSTDLEHLQNAFAARIQSFEDRDSLAGPLIETFGSTGSALLSKVLPAIGGQKALKYILNSDVPETVLDWQSPEAIYHMYDYLNDDQYRSKAFAAILLQASSSMLTAEERALSLRKLLEMSQRVDEKRQVISAMGRAKTYSNFRYLEGMLSDTTINDIVARSLLNVALPPAGSSEGLEGYEVYQTLQKVDTLLAASETDIYTKSFLHNYMQGISRDTHFVSMFNGQDFEGWQGLVDNPIIRDTLFGFQRRAKQAVADSMMHINWKIVDGAITFVGDGYDNLCSIEDYRDFELLVDWKITKDGDSGIYLRGSPQVQIWDTSRVESGAQVGSGGLYNNQVHESKPLFVGDNPVGEWNTFRIIMIHDKVTVYLNGKKVTDNTVLENYWDRSLPIFREGPIELQAHGTDLQFRNIYVREINAAPDLTELEVREGFKPLFNGVNLDGWVGNKDDYVVENGEIVVYPGASGSGGNLYTEKEYSDFRLRFEFKLTPGANNGIGIHAPLTGDAAYQGKEIQVLDDSAAIYANLKPYQYHGSVYGLAAARRGSLNPVGEWNTEEINVDGDYISVTVNDKQVVRVDLKRVRLEGPLDGKEHPGLDKTIGHIGFLGHGSEVHFRNIRIVELNQEDANETDEAPEEDDGN